MYHLDPRLVVQVLQLLWNIYTSRRAKPKPAPDKEGHEPAVAAEVPNPDKLRELIEEVQGKPEQTEESISAAIEEKFPPTEARQVKNDFAAFALLASPPDFADYDFVSLIQKYVKNIQTIALKMDLFRLRGAKYYGELRLLEMSETGGSLAPSAKANDAVYILGDIVSASVAKRSAVLTDEQEDTPLVFVVEGVFRYASYGGYAGQRTESGVQAYKLRAGQESNWLAFYVGYKNFAATHPGFRGFEYRLKASDVKAIIAALKKDIVGYLRDVEEERPLVRELRRELEELSSIIPQNPSL